MINYNRIKKLRKKEYKTYSFKVNMRIFKHNTKLGGN